MLKSFILFILSFSFTALLAQSSQLLSATDFNSKLKSTPNALLIDVRTVGEFQGGHLDQAINYPLNASDFSQKIAQLDKSRPVFLYCLSGGRSNAAAQQMIGMGFATVYDMEGGILQWRAKKLPEVTSNAEAKGMSLIEYNMLTAQTGLVLVDFYADWCAPCKKMKPFIEEIGKEMAEKVEIVRIDADAEKALCKQLKVDALPVLVLYQNGREVWKHKAFISKAELVSKIKQFSNK